jgi:ABC-type multidrug transport system fused ATPase/permease subunit
MKRPSAKSAARDKADRAAYPLRDLARDCWEFLAPYKGELAFASVMRLLGDLAQLWPWYAISQGVTALSRWHPGDPTLPALFWFASWVAAAAARNVTMYYARTRGYLAGERAALDLRARGIARLLELDIAWHEKENAGNKLQRIESAANGVSRVTRIWIGNVIEIAVSLVGTLTVIAFTDLRITLAALAFLALYAPLSAWLRRDVGAAVRAVHKSMEEVSGSMFEALSNVRTAKVLDMPRALVRIIGTRLDGAYGSTARRTVLGQRMSLVQSLCQHAFKGAAVLWIVVGVMHGRYEVGFLLLFHGYFNRLTDSAAELAEVSQELDVSRVAMSRMADTLRAPVADPGTKPYPRDWKAISLRGVSYSYAGRQVLHDVSFDIRRGERVGVVGLSGAGKSTLFKLLLKELEDYTGDILVDGVPLRDIRKRDWYRHAAVVLQETEVFNFPLRQNVTIAAEDGQRDRKRLMRALQVAHVTDFLKKLPDGVETVIGEKGVKLSGGERQRVGIARAVFKRPDVLFLDEATSHLDLESEERIRDSLHVFFKDVTAVAIAHRLTTIKEMDRIVVLERGRVAEQGPFRELLRRRGRFHELWELQKLGKA